MVTGGDRRGNRGRPRKDAGGGRGKATEHAAPRASVGDGFQDELVVESKEILNLEGEKLGCLEEEEKLNLVDTVFVDQIGRDDSLISREVEKGRSYLEAACDISFQQKRVEEAGPRQQWIAKSKASSAAQTDLEGNKETTDGELIMSNRNRLVGGEGRWEKAPMARIPGNDE
ncbi:hypothetical protein Dimus_015620 [Dionaea muscipula]